jgi:hypothetical protein
MLQKSQHLVKEIVPGSESLAHIRERFYDAHPKPPMGTSGRIVGMKTSTLTGTNYL